MPRVATKLTTNGDGSFSARKRIPADVQEDYEKLYGVRWEEPAISKERYKCSERRPRRS
jgi:hypothetical protein